MIVKRTFFHTTSLLTELATYTSSAWNSMFLQVMGTQTYIISTPPV